MRVAHTLKSTRCPALGPPVMGTGTNFIPSPFTKGASCVAAAEAPALAGGEAKGTAAAVAGTDEPATTTRKP